MMDQFTRNSITQELYEEGSRGRVRFSGRLDTTNATKDALGISMRHLDAEGGNGDAVVQPVREVVPRGEQGIRRRSVRVAANQMEEQVKTYLEASKSCDGSPSACI